MRAFFTVYVHFGALEPGYRPSLLCFRESDKHFSGTYTGSPSLWSRVMGGAERFVGARSETSMSRQHVCSFDLQRLGRSQHFFSPYNTTMMIIVIPFAAAEPPNCFMNSPFCSSIDCAFLVNGPFLFNGERGVRELVEV